MTMTRDLASRLDLTNIDLPTLDVSKLEVPKSVRKQAKKARKRADKLTSSARPALPFVVAAGIGLLAVVVLRRRRAASAEAPSVAPQYEPVRPVGSGDARR